LVQPFVNPSVSGREGTAMRRRWAWRLIFVVFLSALALIAHLARRNDPMKQVQRELERLRRAGEPTRLVDLLPPVPPLQDGTPFYQAAIQQLEATQASLPKPVWDNLYNFISRQPTQPVNLAEVERALKAVEPALAMLRKALTYPHMRLTNWNVDNPASVMFPHFSRLREFTRLLSAEAFWHKRKGDLNGAMDSCVATLRLTRRMGDEIFLIAFLVQGAIFSISMNTVQRVLEDADPSPQAYQALLRELRAWDIDRDFVRALQMERVFMIWACDWMREKASRRELHDLLRENGDRIELSVWLKGKAHLIAQNELMGLRHYQQAIAFARKGVPYDWAQIDRWEKAWEQVTRQGKTVFALGATKVTWQPHAIADLFSPTLSFTFQKVAGYHAFQRLGETAIALRLYRKEHGRYPENLSALVPRYLSSVPADPFDGKSLRYRREGTGFRLWSIGPDRKDDGGVEGKPGWWVQGDIVWAWR
jgi:tetratricopeptide (TPR) repeat protein